MQRSDEYERQGIWENSREAAKNEEKIGIEGYENTDKIRR